MPDVSASHTCHLGKGNQLAPWQSLKFIHHKLLSRTGKTAAFYLVRLTCLCDTWDQQEQTTCPQDVTQDSPRTRVPLSWSSVPKDSQGSHVCIETTKYENKILSTINTSALHLNLSQGYCINGQVCIIIACSSCKTPRLLSEATRCCLSRLSH